MGPIDKRSGWTCVAFGGPEACVGSLACQPKVQKPWREQRLAFRQVRTFCDKTLLSGDQATIRCVETMLCVAFGGPWRVGS